MMSSPASIYGCAATPTHKPRKGCSSCAGNQVISIRPPARPHGVLAGRQRRSRRFPHRRARAPRDAGLRDHRSRQRVGDGQVLSRGGATRHQADHRCRRLDRRVARGPRADSADAAVPKRQGFQALERVADAGPQGRSDARPRGRVERVAEPASARGPDRVVGRPSERARQGAGRRAATRAGGPRLLAHAAARPFLCRAAARGQARRSRVHRARGSFGRSAGCRRRRDQRRLLPRSRRVRGARNARVYWPGPRAR